SQSAAPLPDLLRDQDPGDVPEPHPLTVAEFAVVGDVPQEDPVPARGEGPGQQAPPAIALIPGQHALSGWASPLPTTDRAVQVSQILTVQFTASSGNWAPARSQPERHTPPSATPQHSRRRPPRAAPVRPGPLAAGGSAGAAGASTRP